MIINEATAFVPIWMVLAAAFGFLAGEACGDLSRHRKCLEKTNSDLREQIEKARTGEEPMCRELKRLRGEINDIHKRIVAVTKSLEKTNA